MNVTRTLCLTCLLCLACSLSTPLLAQKKKTKGKKLSTAKALKEANMDYTNGQNVKAEELYRQVNSQTPGNYDVILRIAHINDQSNKTEEAIKWYETAVAIDPTRSDTTLFELATAQKKLGHYEESNKTFQQFLDIHKHNDAYMQQAKFEIDGSTFAEKAIKLPSEYRIKKLTINTKADDLAPTQYKESNNRYLIFTSARPIDKQKKTKVVYEGDGDQGYSDLWVVKMLTDSTFGAPENMGKTINTSANDGNAVISPDGLTMYYSICGGGKLAKKYNCSIFQSKFDPDKKKWNHFELVEGINGTVDMQVSTSGKTKPVPTWDSEPCLSADGNTMFFASDREGGVGEIDIWSSTKAGNTWTKPVNLGKDINTPFSEYSPTLGADGKTLFFASNGLKGFGGYDLYRAEGSGTHWKAPQNMGYPMNSSYDESNIMWYKQDSIGLLSSNRTGGSGRFDIYYIKRIKKAHFEITVQGHVRDTKTKQIIPFATVTLSLTGDNTLTALDTFKTDQSGSYKFTLDQGNDYKLVGNAPEYLANEEFVSTKDILQTTTLEKDIDIFLERIEVNHPIVLQNIYYDFDKADLRSESIAELDRLIKILQQNSGITIQIGSHTDTNGSEKYNLSLSDRRAASVVEYLLKNGISKRRINAFGYGESQPLIYPEMNDADEQANRRTEFRIKTLDLPQDK